MGPERVVHLIQTDLPSEAGPQLPHVESGLVGGGQEYTRAQGVSPLSPLPPPPPKVFKSRTPPEAIALCSSLLEYTPSSRLSPLEACAHSFFDELRCPGTQLPNNRPLPPLFNFSPGGEGTAWDLGCWRGSQRL